MYTSDDMGMYYRINKTIGMLDGFPAVTGIRRDYNLDEQQMTATSAIESLKEVFGGFCSDKKISELMTDVRCVS
jgi:hypothetical protein